MNAASAGVGRRMALLLFGLTAVLALTLTVRMMLGARSELRRATAAQQRGDRAAERMHLRRAMAHYLPGNPWVAQAARLLRRRAVEAERAGRAEEALTLWHTLRGAILALRGLNRPFAEHLPQANRRIVALSARHPQAAALLKSDAGQQRLLERLERPEETDPGWTAAALGGFLLFLLGMSLLLLVGLDRETRPRSQRFWPLLALTVVGVGLFLTGLANAAIG